MPKEEWGVKRLCPKCATRFYDLKNDPMTCPSCGAEIDLASLLETGNKSAGSKAKEKTKVAKPADDLDDVEVILDDDDDDDAKADDDDLLVDDDDDVIALEEVVDVAVETDES